MSASSTAAAGRAFVEAQMTDVCEIGVEVRGALDETTGEYAVSIDPVYSGKCLFKASVRLGSDADAQSQILFVQNAVLKVPLEGTDGIKKNHTVLITESNDPGLVGTKARVTGPFAQTYATSRRVPVEVVT